MKRRIRFNASTNHGRTERLIAQLDVPVGEIDKVLPEIMLWSGKSDVDERPPFWPFRFANQAHVRFSREPVAFARIASNARANHVFPRSCPSAIARHDVIEIELASIEKFAAILTGVLVALENIVASEFYFLLWKPIENQKYNHPRDTNLKRNSCDYFVIRRICR